MNIPSKTYKSGDLLIDCTSVRIGKEVVISWRGLYRAAIIDQVGPRFACCLFVTPTALANAERKDTIPTISQAQVPLNRLYLSVDKTISIDNFQKSSGRKIFLSASGRKHYLVKVEIC
jgi:hypothetical protein